MKKNINETSCYFVELKTVSLYFKFYPSLVIQVIFTVLFSEVINKEKKYYISSLCAKKNVKIYYFDDFPFSLD